MATIFSAATKPLNTPLPDPFLSFILLSEGIVISTLIDYKFHKSRD